MKICDLVQFYSPLSGGIKRYVQDKSRYLARRDDCQHVLIIPGNEKRTRHSSSGTVYEIESPRILGSRSYRALLARNEIRRIIKNERPDVIEVADPYYSAWVATGIGRELNIPIVGFYHSDYPRALGRTLRRFCGLGVERACSKLTERYTAKLYNRMNATVVATRKFEHTLRQIGVKRIAHVPLGVDPCCFYPRTSREAILKELVLTPATVLLLYAGRLAREKNILRLIQMMDILSNYQKDYHLLLVGDGELRNRVTKEVALRPNISHLPYSSSQARLADLYSAADLFVHAGMAETFGLVSIESQCCGTPVVAVRGGGMEETLCAEPNPVLAEDASPRSLAAAVEDACIEAVDHQQRLARHRRTAARFGSEQTYQGLLDLYEDLQYERRARRICMHLEEAPNGLYGTTVYAE